jgi:hypothetical protein
MDLLKGLQESIKANLQFHGQPLHEATQGCLFNQIALHTLQLFQGLKSFCNLQKIFAQDYETTTCGALRRLVV